MKKRPQIHQHRNIFTLLLPLLSIIIAGFFIVFTSFYEAGWFFNWTGIRAEIKDSVKITEQFGIKSGIDAWGISSEDDLQRRRWIMKSASVNELLKLTEYPNGNVKALAYEGLIKKREFGSKTELILKAIEDSTYFVSFQSGCIVWDMGVGEYLIQNVLRLDDRFPPLPADMQIDYGLSDEDKTLIKTAFKKKNQINL